MKTLEQEILDTEQVIAGLPATQIHGLERSLRRLSAAQRAYIGAALHRLEEASTLPPRYLRFLEHFFDRWSDHSLATKLVLIGRITQAASQWTDRNSSDDSLPGGVFRLPAALQRAS